MTTRNIIRIACRDSNEVHSVLDLHRRNMSVLRRYCCIGAILATILTSVLAYHFDADNIILHEDPAISGSRGSYFGYTVALWNPGKKNLNESWMFVGAPKSDSKLNSGKKEPGTVFKCRIGAMCEEWAMDEKWTMDDGSFKKPMPHSWFGASMNIENKTNPEVLVCAPRQVSKERPNTDAGMKRLGMLGICYSRMASDSSDSRNTIQRLMSSEDPFGVIGYRFQEIGFSVHMNPDNSPPELILGCPKPLSPHGTMIRFHRSRDRFTVPSHSEVETYDNDYSGYAVTSGKYFNAKERIYAIGTPRGASLRGNVSIYNFPARSRGSIKIYKSIEGYQIGEYFGAALASCDIDGDKKEDLLVGAPQWTEILDEGRVYSFRGNKGLYQFMTHSQIDGKIPRGRFGSAITCLGDIDYDGYADVAVGAPYDGNGAVYIFHGSKNGLTRDPQKIAGPEATKGFGISISEPRDVDNNGYADIAVGAYLSGHITLIRSKRVVSMTVNMSSDLIGGRLDREAESFKVNVCSTYGGPHAPEELNVTNELKIEEMYGRATVETEGKNWTIYKFNETLKSGKSKSCRNFTIRINKAAHFEYLNPLQLSVSQRLNTQRKNSTLWVKPHNISGDDKFDTSDAVTNGAHPDGVEYPLAVPFETDCNNDVCRSNLSIEMTTNLENSTSYVIGSTQTDLRLDVKVHNFGDNAYSAKAYINIPSSIGILKIPSTCTKYSKTATHNGIMCEVGNPLAENQTKSFNMSLDMSKMPSSMDKFEFEATANTTSEDAAIGGHKFDFLINGIVEADIGIVGKTDMDWKSYMTPEKEKPLPNIMISHFYEIRNYQATPLSEALLRISYPTHWIYGDNEIEIVKLKKTLGNLDRKTFSCQNANESLNIHSLSYDATTMPEWLFGENSSRLAPHLEKKFTIVNDKVFSASPQNRTIYINTTNPLVKWQTIDCIIGPFETARSTAKVVLTFDLLLSNLPLEMIEGKDIIFFATNGSTEITVPPNFIQTVNEKPDTVMVGTMIIGSRSEGRVAAWWIILSILVGLLLLALIIFALCKFGFFKQSKKAKLNALMKQRGRVVPRVTIEASSSRDALDIT